MVQCDPGMDAMAIKENNMVIFDERKTVADLTDSEKQRVKQCHPDKGGVNAVFRLLRTLPSACLA